jgi:pSer/pThr/pTyr-binding forkhead associated (FHA) protein
MIRLPSTVPLRPVHYHASVGTLKATEDDGWAIDDPVSQLRIRGDEQIFELPCSETRMPLIVGAADECDLVLRDPTGCVSRHHAHLVRERGAWILHDQASTNGIRQDGERRMSIQLAPGVEIEIGGIKLIAESGRLRALRAYLSRVVGWDRARLDDVDHGIQAVRTMATRRAALVLCGAGELGRVAERIHQLALGPDRPFIVCARDDSGKADPANNGTFCFVDDKLPDDFAEVAARLTASGAKSRLVVCSPSREDATEAMTQLARCAVLELPDLEMRPDEIGRLILEYAEDAVAALGAPSNGFREHEPIWLRQLPLATLDEVGEVTFRLVALRNWNVRGGAQRLGISHVALSRWARRRRIPT